MDLVRGNARPQRLASAIALDREPGQIPNYFPAQMKLSRSAHDITRPFRKALLLEPQYGLNSTTPKLLIEILSNSKNLIHRFFPRFLCLAIGCLAHLREPSTS